MTIQSMIQANELKLGNFLIHKEYGLAMVVSISSDNTVFLENQVSSEDYNCDLDENIEPIPLTEEMLLKCGFEKNKSSYTFIIDEFTILWYNESDMFHKSSFEVHLCKLLYNPNGEISTKRANFKIDVEYLHQLQNLFFALTNKDLEVKL